MSDHIAFPSPGDDCPDKVEPEKPKGPSEEQLRELEQDENDAQAKTDPSTITNLFTIAWVIPLVQRLIDNKLILFVKEVRALTGLGLKEAKDLSDAIFAQFTFPNRTAQSYEAIQLAQVNKDCEAYRREIIDQDRRIDQLLEKVRELENKIENQQTEMSRLAEELDYAEEMYENAVERLEAYRTVLRDVID